MRGEKKGVEGMKEGGGKRKRAREGGKEGVEERMGEREQRKVEREGDH